MSICVLLVCCEVCFQHRPCTIVSRVNLSLEQILAYFRVCLASRHIFSSSFRLIPTCLAVVQASGFEHNSRNHGNNGKMEVMTGFLLPCFLFVPSGNVEFYVKTSRVPRSHSLIVTRSMLDGQLSELHLGLPQNVEPPKQKAWFLLEFLLHPPKSGSPQTKTRAEPEL